MPSSPQQQSKRYRPSSLVSGSYHSEVPPTQWALSEPPFITDYDSYLTSSRNYDPECEHGDEKGRCYRGKCKIDYEQQFLPLDERTTHRFSTNQSANPSYIDRPRPSNFRAPTATSQPPSVSSPHRLTHRSATNKSMNPRSSHRRSQTGDVPTDTLSFRSIPNTADNKSTSPRSSHRRSQIGDVSPDTMSFRSVPRTAADGSISPCSSPRRSQTGDVSPDTISLRSTRDISKPTRDDMKRNTPPDRRKESGSSAFSNIPSSSYRSSTTGYRYR